MQTDIQFVFQVVKACPYCKSTKIVIRRAVNYWLECWGCGLNAPSMDTLEAAVSTWNERSDSQRIARIVFNDNPAEQAACRG